VVIPPNYSVVFSSIGGCSGYLLCFTGEIEVDGRNISSLNVKWWRGQIGLVGQEASLFAGTIRDNILYGRLEASDEEIIKAAKSANIHNFITSLSQVYSRSTLLDSDVRVYFRS